MRKRLPRNMGQVRTLTLTLMLSMRTTPMTSLRQRTRRRKWVKILLKMNQRRTGRMRKSVFPASDRFSVTAMILRMRKQSRRRALRREILLGMRMMSLKSSLDSETQVSTRMMTQNQDRVGVLVGQDSMMMRTLSMMTSTHTMMKTMTA